MAAQGRMLSPGSAGMALCLLVALAACQARPTPTPLLRSMTVTLTMPVADKAVISAAEDVFSERLRAIGITTFTVTTGAVMTFNLSVPATFDAAAVDAVLHRVGLVEFVPWPANSQPANPDEPVPAAFLPLFDAAGGVGTAEVTTDPSGMQGVDITLSAVASEAIATYTTQHVGGQLPLVLDGFVLTAPTINSPITDGVIRLTAPDPPPIPLLALAAMITSGPLPAAWGGQP
jgi:hypothetical protein